MNGNTNRLYIFLNLILRTFLCKYIHFYLITLLFIDLIVQNDEETDDYKRGNVSGFLPAGLCIL